MEQGGDYLWVIEENQPTVKEALSLLFARPPWGEAIPEAMREASHRGRREWPWLRASSAPNHYLEWPYAGVALCRTGLLHGTHRTHKGVSSREKAYAITSLTPEQAGPARLLKLWRGHWRIANQVHWVRDVTFDEDRSQVRTGTAPQVMAALRNAVIGLLRRTGSQNIAAALRRYSWNLTASLSVLGLPIPNY